jgi:hypothetical protein
MRAVVSCNFSITPKPGTESDSLRGAAMNEIGKFLVAIGLLLTLAGVVVLVAARTGLPLGRLPGNFAYRGKNVSVFFPLGACIFVSVVLSIFLYLLSRFRG